MTTEERLMNVGWQKLSHFAELTILGRENQRLLYAPQTDSIERIYSVKETTSRLLDLRYPTSLDLLNIFNPVENEKEEVSW